MIRVQNYIYLFIGHYKNNWLVFIYTIAWEEIEFIFYTALAELQRAKSVYLK